MTEPHLRISSVFSFRCRGIWIDCASLAPDARWLMAQRWCISHVRGAGGGEGGGGELFCPCLLRPCLLFFISCAPSVSLAVLLSPCSVLLDLSVASPRSEQRSISDALTLLRECPSIETGIKKKKKKRRRRGRASSGILCRSFSSHSLFALVSFSPSDWRPNSLLIIGL